jgi:aminopeptidase N
LSQTLQPGPVQINIKYEGDIGNGMSGFFRAKYKSEDGDDVFLLTTQFEPCYARTAFPCFDEPNLKATFDLELEVPAHFTALSNMPVKTVTNVPSDPSLQRVLFERSPRMSTYLLAWAIGDLEYIESKTEQHHGGSPVTVRVYTPLGMLPSAHFALDVACRVLDLYKKLFTIDYPLPKCDHLVVPEFVCGAMENWGLITYK